MKRLVVALIAVLALGVIAVSASADQKFTNTCGQNSPIGGKPSGVDVSSAGFAYNGGNGSGGGKWTVTWNSNCGYGGTQEWELQHLNANGSYADVHEWNGGDIDHQAAQPGDGFHSWVKTPQSLNPCAHGDTYRLVMYWMDALGFGVELHDPGVPC
jgi:hypothetical protein